MPEDKKNIVKMAHMYSQEGRWDKAIAEYKKLIALEPEDFNAHSMLGDVYFKKGEAQNAFDTYALCYDAYLRLGQSEKAALAKGKMLKLDGASLDDDGRRKLAVFKRQNEADAFLAAGDRAKAAETYAAILNLDPDHFDLYQKLGDLLLEMGDKPGACVRYREIGNLYLKNRLVKKALPLFQKVLDLNPDDFEAHKALADLHAKAGNDSEAKKEMLFVTEALFQRGDLEQAFQYAQKAEQLKAIESYNYLGQIELKRGHRDQARNWFDKLLKFKPNHGGALWGTASVQLAEGRLEDARLALTKVPKADRYHGEALAALADLDAKDKPEEALKGYLEAAALLLAKGARAQGRDAEAKAKALGADPEQLQALRALEPPEPEPQPEPAAPAKPGAKSSAAGRGEAPSSPPLVGALPEKLVILKSGEQSKPESQGFKLVRGASQFQDSDGAPAGEARAPKAGTANPPAASSSPAPAAAPAPAEPSPALLEQVKAFDAVLPASVFEPEAVRAKAPKDAPAAGNSAGPEGGAGAPLPPLASLQTPARTGLPELKPLPPLGEAAAPASTTAVASAAESAEDEIGTLLGLAGNFESESSWDEALNLYQRVLALDKNHAGAKEGVSRVYRQLAGSAPRPAAAPAPPAAPSAPPPSPVPSRPAPAPQPVRPASGAGDLDATALAKAKADAEAHHKREREEAESREREKLKALEREHEERAAKLRAEIEALKASEAEARERVRKASEEAEAFKARMEGEIRARLEAELGRQAQAKSKAEEDARRLSEVQARLKAEEEAKRQGALQAKHKAEEDARRQAEVLARVQAQQKERLEPLRRTIEEMRHRVEHAEPAGAGAPGTPGHAPEAEAHGEDGLGGLDGFMTAAVADIYVKQGLVQEARKIYAHILEREPGNAEIRAKLERLPGPPAPPPPAAPGAVRPASDKASGPAPAQPSEAAKKSKVSYL